MMIKATSKNNKDNIILKKAGTLIFYFAISFAFPVTIAYTYVLIFTSIFAILPLMASLIVLCLGLINIIDVDLKKYGKEIGAGIIIGLTIGIITPLIYLAPITSAIQYPISMTVFYPNHPNITATQKCSSFLVSSSGYLNGQPINLTNETTCSLPINMSKDTTDIFDCSIFGKNITCVNNFGYEKVTWKGTILNVSEIMK